MFNILEEHYLDSFVTSVIKEPTTNSVRTNYKSNQAKAKQIIYDSVKDNLMSVITPLKTARSALTHSLISMRRILLLKRGL